MTKRYLSKRKKIAMYISIILVVTLCIGVGYATYLYNKTENMITESHEEIGRENEISNFRDQKVDPVDDSVSVLLIGVDDSEHRSNNGSGRSDALILATFNKSSSSVKLLSIPRDTYVFVPQMGRYTKVNHAHAQGGAKATIETVENFLEIPVDYFVRMNFNAFVDVVDAIGGVMFNVPFEIVESDSNDKRNSIHLSPGYQRLNGEEALAIARNRKYDSDLERGKRQQELLKAIAEQTLSIGSVLKLEEILTAVGSNMNTNLTFDEMKGFVSYGLNKDVAINFINFEGYGGYLSDGLWYYHIKDESKAQISDELQEHLELEQRDVVREE